jgi:hypothetical protein
MTLGHSSFKDDKRRTEGGSELHFMKKNHDTFGRNRQKLPPFALQQRSTEQQSRARHHLTSQRVLEHSLEIARQMQTMCTGSNLVGWETV